MTPTLFSSVEGLTEHEISTLIVLFLNLLDTTHNTNRITGKEIVKWFQAQGQVTSDIRVRKMINYIRVRNLCAPKVLIGASNGYFLTADRHTVQDQIDSITGRIESMKAVIDALLVQKQNLERNIPLSSK